MTSNGNGAANGTNARTGDRLAGKVCIVTGAAGGIGFETSILFAKQSAKAVLIADINAGLLCKAHARMMDLMPGATIRTVLCDVSKEADVQALVEAADEFGGVDVMFNNAGIMHPDDDDEFTSERVWDLTHNINVKGVWYGCKHAVASLRRYKKTTGSIINTASVVALVGSSAPQLAYTASKGAVLAMTRELAIVHGKEGYRFNALCPGPLNTHLLQSFLDTEEKRHRRTIHLPTGRFGEAIEQAHAVVFMACDESTYLTGQEMVMDGGMTKAYVTAQGLPLWAPHNHGF